MRRGGTRHGLSAVLTYLLSSGNKIDVQKILDIRSGHLNLSIENNSVQTVMQ